MSPATHNLTHTRQPWLLTFEEARSALRVSRRTLQKLVSTSALAVVRLGRRVLFRPEDLDAFLMECRVERGAAR